MPDILPQTAAMLAIGDELLSGRTKDRNIGHLADVLTLAGIDLKEVRIVADEADAIASAINALRRSYTYVFTSGGIGPTHDDITADAVGQAFGLPVDYHPQAYERLAENYRARKLEFTEARKRMARTPTGAELIDNPVSVAPGFRVENVHVMAGVPSIFQAMLDNVMAGLPHGRAISSETLHCPFGEGEIGGPLADIQKRHPGVAIGSYPKYEGTYFHAEIVLRSRDAAALSAAKADVEEMLAQIVSSRPSA
ncbi:competence/damage-inducible protein A [Aureimonas populi]|uniref:Competence/damage-inducible protein A n=1 Tax=Aureimonas populi TaxID=1701758 RepID=A0ABW5CKV4_9HYPH|nr:competence/damage-inducible protein A [Aureimonas populi]